MTSYTVNYLHSWADYFLSTAKMVQNREVGWQTIDRRSGKFIREQQPLKEKARLLLIFNPAFEWIDTTHWFRQHMHKKSEREGVIKSSEESKNKIQAFVDFYHINMNEFQPSDIHAYNSFQEFFTRHHTPESRPIYAEGDASIAVISADCRAVVYDSVSEAQQLWIKGRHFSIPNLILDDTLARTWGQGAAIASYRLSPQDYHRYHSPVTGTVVWWKEVDGQDLGVDPLALRSSVDILTENSRCAVCIETEDFGQVLFVAIGANEVGTIKLNEAFKEPGTKVKQGQEVGIFEFGGSSILVCFEPGRIQFDEDLVKWSKEAIQVDVQVGQSLGKAVKPRNRVP